MAVLTVNVKYDQASIPGTPIPGFNNTGNFVASGTGVIFSNLLTSTGATTGLSLTRTVGAAGNAAGNGSNGSAGWCTVATAHGLPEKFWDSGHNMSTFGNQGTDEIAGFAPGQTGTITLAGHQLQNRTTVFTINGANATSYVDTNTSSALPPAPVVINFTADGSGKIAIRASSTSVASIINGFVLQYDPVVAVSITYIDPLHSGQQFLVTVSDNSYAATNLICNDGAITKTVPVTATVAGSFSGNAPALADGQTMLRVGNVSAKLTDGSIETGGVTVAYSVYSGHPDNPTIVQFTSVELTDVSSPYTFGAAFAFPVLPVVGDDIIGDSSRWNIYSNGILETKTDYTGVSQFYWRTRSDGICHAFTVTTEGGIIISVDFAKKIEGRSLSAMAIIAKAIGAR